MMCDHFDYSMDDLQASMGEGFCNFHNTNVNCDEDCPGCSDDTEQDEEDFYEDDWIQVKRFRKAAAEAGLRDLDAMVSPADDTGSPRYPGDED